MFERYFILLTRQVPCPNFAAGEKLQILFYLSEGHD
jgi:hypothetical protein